ncbi:MAG: hypothetical protein ACK5RL_09410 [Acidimicrobiales bacterium]
MTKRFVPAVLVLVAVAIIGWLLAGAVATGDQLVIRFLAAIIVAGLGLYVISDLRMRTNHEAEQAQTTRRTGTSSDSSPPANSTAAFMATVTGKRTTAAPPAAPGSVSVFDLPPGAAGPGDDGQLPPVDPTTGEGVIDDGVAAGARADGATNGRASADDVGDPGSSTVASGTTDDEGAAYEADDDELAAWPARPTGLVGDRPPPRHRSSMFDRHGGRPDLDDEEGNDPDTTRTTVHRSSPAPLFGSGALQGVDRDEPSVDPHPTALFPALEVDLEPKTVLLRSRAIDRPASVFSINTDPAKSDHTTPDTGEGGEGVRPDSRLAPLRSDQRGGPSPAAADPTPVATMRVVDMTTWPPPTADTAAELAASAPTDPVPADDAVPAIHAVPTGDAVPASDAVPVIHAVPSPGGEHTVGDAVALTPEPAANDVGTADGPVTEPSTRVPATFGSSDVERPRDRVAAASYASPIDPIYNLPVVRAAAGADDIDTAIAAGELEVISTLIRQGRLSTSGPISDRDVRTMVYVAFTSSELRKILTAGGVIDGDNSNLDLGPVELFQGSDRAALGQLETAPLKRCPEPVEIDLDTIDLDTIDLDTEEHRSLPARSQAL